MKINEQVMPWRWSKGLAAIDVAWTRGPENEEKEGGGFYFDVESRKNQVKGIQGRVSSIFQLSQARSQDLILGGGGNEHAKRAND